MPIKRFSRIIRTVLAIIICLYVGAISLLNIPYIQQRLSVAVANELGRQLKTGVSINRIDIGLLNRIIIDDVTINDQENKVMLKISRLSAKFNLRELVKGKISIGSAQLFGFTANLYKKTSKSKPNYQFILDALSSKDKNKPSKPLDLRINSLLLRRGNLSYNEWYVPVTPRKFNIKHLGISRFNANISLKALNKDSLNISIRRMDFDEHSDFHLKHFKMKATANRKRMYLTNMELELPATKIVFDTIKVNYAVKANKVLTESIKYKGALKNSIITLSDISAFIPALKLAEDPLQANMIAEGDMRHTSLKDIHVQSVHKDIQLDANIFLHNLSGPEKLSLTGKVSSLTINNTGMHILLKSLIPNITETPSILSRLGNIHFKGEVHLNTNGMATYGVLRTGLGTAKADMNINGKKKTYDGRLECEGFELGKLLDNNKIGKISFSGDISGKNINAKYPDSKVNGNIASLFYNGYEYKNIALDGAFQNGGFDGNCSLDDHNISLNLDGKFNIAQAKPYFNVNIKVSKFNPYNLNLTKKYKNTDFSISMYALFTGNSPDNMVGNITIDSLTMKAPDKYYEMKEMTIQANKTDNGLKQLKINSDIIQATVTGDYSYATIPTSIISTMQKYIPSLITVHKKNQTHNNFSFQAEVYKSDFWSKVLDIPLHLNSTGKISGYFSDKTSKLKIEGYFPSFSYNNNRYESGMITCENPNDMFNCTIRLAKAMSKGAMLNFVVNASAQNDQLKTDITWGNNTKTTYSGKFSSLADFFKSEGKNPQLLADLHVQPTEVIVNDTTWHIHPSEINFRPHNIKVNNFLFEHKDQHLKINGVLDKKSNDSLIVDLQDINLEYVFDILHFHPVDFKGLATGKAYISSALNSPNADTYLTIRDFSFENGYMGDMNIYGKYDKQQKGIYLNAHIAEPGISTTHVEGLVSPAKGGLDLFITANQSNLSFLNSFVGGIFSNVEGRGKGWVRVFGPFSMLNLEGDVCADVKAKLKVLNTPFIIKQDSIHLRPNLISFNNVNISDAEGNKGIVNGTVKHNCLHNLKYSFEINSKGLLCYDTKTFNGLPFYGSMYGTGTANITGGGNVLNVNVNMTTNNKSLLVYNAGSPNEITNRQFITFYDKSPKREEDNIIVKFNQEDNEEKEQEDDTPMDIRINMLVDATPDATLKVIMDPVAGDNITCHGNGNIRASYYNKGDFRMFGDYNITQGVYKLSMQQVIRKDFQLKQGSVSFSGDPMAADLDVQAVYTVNNVSLSDLTSSGNFSQNNVKVNCLMNLSGKLLHPVFKFDLELPTVNEEEKEMVKSLISTDEEMNMQIIYLLGVGRFYTYEYARANGTGTQSSAMSSLLSSTLSGQVNNMLGQFINNNNWNFGTNLSTGTNGWTDVEWENMLSGRMLNNRLLINGSFGYKENAIKNNNFVGDFDVQWLLTPSGEISLKGYNETNDRYFAKSTLTTQGVGIVFKKEFNSWKDLFRWGKNKNIYKQPAKTDKKKIPKNPDTSFIKWNKKGK